MEVVVVDLMEAMVVDLVEGGERLYIYFFLFLRINIQLRSPTSEMMLEGNMSLRLYYLILINSLYYCRGIVESLYYLR